MIVSIQSPLLTYSGERLLLQVFDVTLICILKANGGKEGGVGHYSD